MICDIVEYMQLSQIELKTYGNWNVILIFLQ
jgi:hypothetical protein